MKRVMNIVDEENNSGEYEIFCTFDSALTKKSYVIYTDYLKDSDGTVLMKAGSYVEAENKLKVDKNLSHEENEMISEVMKNIIDRAREN